MAMVSVRPEGSPPQEDEEERGEEESLAHYIVQVLSRPVPGSTGIYLLRFIAHYV